MKGGAGGAGSKWTSRFLYVLLVIVMISLAMGLSAGEEAPFRRERSTTYFAEMDKLDMFSSMTQGLFEAEALRIIDPAKPMVALTFDDGPSKYTPRIVQLLEQYGGRATFFMVGNRVNNFREAVEAVAQQGSEIATHTWSHPKLPSLSRGSIETELSKSIRAMSDVSGLPVTLMRPPYGSINGDVRGVCGNMGLMIIRWSVDTRDWETKSANKTYQAIMESVKDGSIILCHDIVPSTAEAMELVIPELIRQGYQLVTVTELLQHSNTAMEAGRVYDQVPR